MALSLARALKLRRAPGGTAPDYDAALAIWNRIETRFKRASDYASLTHGEQLFHRVFFALDSEVENGGLHQYLENSSGDDAERVKADLTEIGAAELRKVLDDLSGLFPSHDIPEERVARLDALAESEENVENFDELFEEADAQYGRAAQTLYTHLMNYVETHRSEFALPD